MKHYIKYTKYLLRHIWNVRRMCWHNGLYWQGLIHDWSKWRPKEFIPYARYFYRKGEAKSKRDSTGYYNANQTGDTDFDKSWLYHQKLNPHHWQYWVLPEDDGGTKIIKIPDKYAREMLCDWWGASITLGFKGQNKDWYEANKGHIQLHPETRAFVEKNVRNIIKPYKV